MNRAPPPPPPPPPPPRPVQGCVVQPTCATMHSNPQEMRDSYCLDEDFASRFKKDCDSQPGAADCTLLHFEWLDCLGQQQMEDTCSLLNSQWPRSRWIRTAKYTGLKFWPLIHIACNRVARLQSLERKLDSTGSPRLLPRSLILQAKGQNADKDVSEHCSPQEIVGHLRLQPCASASEVVIESTVVAKCWRGLGLGRKLMEEAECRARGIGADVIWLSTHDKQDFYARIGYIETEYMPEQVSCLGGLGATEQAGLTALLVRGRPNTRSEKQWMRKNVSRNQHVEAKTTK